jgi:hypothetical protein
MAHGFLWESFEKAVLLKRLFFSRAKETLRTPDTISQITLIDNEKDEEAQHFAGCAMAEAWNMEERPSFRRRGPSSNDALPPNASLPFTLIEP